MSNETLEMMQGQRVADPSEGGLGDALDRFFGDSAEPKVEVAKQETAPVKQEAPPTTPEPQKQDLPAKKEEGKQEKAPEVKEINIEEDFFGEEKKEEAQEFDEKSFDQETEALAQGLEGKAGDKFKALRNELKEAKQKTLTPDVQKKIEELELKASEAEGLRKKVEELSNVSAKIRMESTDEFAAQVKAPADALWGEVQKMAQRYEGDAGFLWKLVTSGDRESQAAAFKEHLGDFSEFDKTEVLTMIKSWNGILDKREELLSKAQEHIDGLDAKRAEENQRLLDENRKNVLTIQKSIWEKYKDVIPGFVDDDGRETQTYKDLMSRSMAVDLTRAGARDQALASFSGVILKHLVKEINEMRKRLFEYEGNDAKSARSTQGTGSAVSNASVNSSGSTQKSFRDMIAEADLV